MVPFQTRVFGTFVGLTLALAGGCDSAPREPVAATEPPVDAPPRPPQHPKSTLPRPDPALIAYDPGNRTLRLYDLPDSSSRWMLVTPRNGKGERVSSTHVFMDEVDAETVSVFYTTDAGQASAKVTLKDVLKARELLAAQR